MIGKILLLILVLLVLLAFVLRLGVLACYDQAGPWVKIRLGPKFLQVYPRKKDPDKEEKKKRKKQAKAEKKAAKKAKKKEDKPEKPPAKRPVGGILDLVWDLLPVVQETVGRFRRKLQIDDLTLHVTWAEEDPADAAIHYGQGWAVVETLLAFLEANFTIKNRQVSLDLDYLTEQPRVYIRVGLSLTAAQLLGIGLWAAGKSLKVLWNHRKLLKPARKPAGADGKKGEVNHGKQASCE